MWIRDAILKAYSFVRWYHPEQGIRLALDFVDVKVLTYTGSKSQFGMTEAELFETLFNIRRLEPGSVLQQTYAPTSVVVRSPSPQQISKSSFKSLSRGTRKLSSPSKVQKGGPRLLALPSSGSTSKVQTGGGGQRKRENSVAIYTGHGYPKMKTD